MEIFNWFQDNWQAIIFAITSIVTGVSIIVRATPTLKDDNVWLPFVKFLSKYIAINRTVKDDTDRQN